MQNSRFNALKIKSDETFAQREYLAHLKKELQRRVEDGETTLTIKYVKGVPKIINKSNENENISSQSKDKNEIPKN